MHIKRLWQIWGICAKYRLDTHIKDIAPAPILALIRAHPAAFGRAHQPLGVKLTVEALGVLFLKLGQLLATRQDLIPPKILHQLAMLQDDVKGIDDNIIKQIINQELADMGGMACFERFDGALAAASIAQVHGAIFDGREVVVKVVRPDLLPVIEEDFKALMRIARFLDAHSSAVRLLNLPQILSDYRQIIIDELDLRLEAANARLMAQNFATSGLLYVPRVYLARARVMIAERVYGVPIDDIHTLDRLGVDKKRLSAMGLAIFFKQLLDDNLFHADMHAGNIWVETTADGKAVFMPRYIGLDCAICGRLGFYDRVVVAKMLSAVMHHDFETLAGVMYGAGWLPVHTSTDTLARAMRAMLLPMIDKPISELAFAPMLLALMEVARTHHLRLPPSLMLLLKTLVHVEGLGRTLDPNLDIWGQARPIIDDWLKKSLKPSPKHAKDALFALYQHAHLVQKNAILAQNPTPPPKMPLWALIFMTLMVILGLMMNFFIGLS